MNLTKKFLVIPSAKQRSLNLQIKFYMISKNANKSEFQLTSCNRPAASTTRDPILGFEAAHRQTLVF